MEAYYIPNIKARTETIHRNIDTLDSIFDSLGKKKFIVLFPASEAKKYGRLLKSEKYFILLNFFYRFH
jgi:hypothetical protein